MKKELKNFLGIKMNILELMDNCIENSLCDQRFEIYDTALKKLQNLETYKTVDVRCTNVYHLIIPSYLKNKVIYLKNRKKLFYRTYHLFSEEYEHFMKLYKKYKNNPQFMYCEDQFCQFRPEIIKKSKKQFFEHFWLTMPG